MCGMWVLCVGVVRVVCGAVKTHITHIHTVGEGRSK
jgi:hypothetical protein